MQHGVVVITHAVEPLAENLHLLDHELHRTAQVSVRLLYAVWPVPQLHAAGPVPDHTQGHQLRMQGTA